MIQERPLVALTIAFAAGILLASCSPLLVWGGILCFLVLAVLFAVTRRALFKMGALMLLLLLFGCGRYLLTANIPSNDISHSAPAYVTIQGVVASAVRVSHPLHAGEPPSGRFVLAARRIEITGAPQTGQEQNPVRLLPVSGEIEARVPLAPVASGGRPQQAGQERQQASEPRSDAEQGEAGQGENAAGISEEEAFARLQSGDTLRLRGRLERPGGLRNPGGFDYAALLRRQGIYATFVTRRYEDWRLVAHASWFDHPVRRLAARLREAVLRHGRRAHDRERAGVLNGILLGDRGDLPGSLNDDFERTSTSHVLATAGLHVGIVVGLLLGALRWFRIAQKPGLLIALGSLVLYAFMAGERASVVRAVIMASVVLVGLLLEREPDLPNALALAAAILLGLNPNSLFEPGFQLSFATVITIVVLMPFAETSMRSMGKRIPNHWPGAKFLRIAAETVTACFFLAIAAQIGAGPLIAYYFNSVSLVSVVANTLVVPIIALIIALGFIAAFLGSLHPVLAWPLDRILDGLLSVVIGIVRTCSHPSWASYSVVSPPAWLIVVCYGVVWGSAWYAQYKANTVKELEDGRNQAGTGE